MGKKQLASPPREDADCFASRTAVEIATGWQGAETNSRNGEGLRGEKYATLASHRTLRAHKEHKKRYMLEPRRASHDLQACQSQRNTNLQPWQQYLSEEVKGAGEAGSACQEDGSAAAPHSRHRCLCVARIGRPLTGAQRVAFICNDDLPALGRQAVLHHDNESGQEGARVGRGGVGWGSIGWDWVWGVRVGRGGVGWDGQGGVCQGGVEWGQLVSRCLSAHIVHELATRGRGAGALGG